MNRSWVTILFLLVFFTFSKGQRSFLQINGFVETTEGESISGAVATIYQGSTKVNSVSTDGSGGFSFSLDFDKKYRLIVTKPGMIQKRIDFNTNIAPEQQKKFINDFAMTLTRDCEGVNTDVFKEPIDIIGFEEGIGNFTSNRAHYEKMQSRVSSVIMSIEKCLQDKFNEKKNAADAAFRDQNYEEARKLYKEALEIIPDNSAAKRQLSQIDKNIKQKAVNEEKYSQLIKEADQMAEQGQLNGAVARYQQANNLKPGDTYSQSKVQELNNQLSAMAQEAQAKKQLDQQYNSLIAQANTAFVQKNYTDAKKLFEEAKTLKPAEAYPAQKIIEAQKGLEKMQQEKAAQEARDNAYADAMAKGQEAMQKGDFSGAQAFFKQALAQKPDASEPRKVIAEAQKLQQQQKEAEIKEQREELNRQFNELIQKADGLLSQSEFDKAVEAYKQAIALKSTDKYASAQLKKAQNMKIKTAQQKQAEIERRYDDAIEQGDALQLEQKFEEAIAAYQSALVAKPADAYANSKIAEAQKILTAQQAKLKEETENKARFNQLVQEADGLFQEQQYNTSKEKYQKALLIYPSETYPKNQVAKIDNILSLQAKEEEYNSIITKADQAFDQQRFDEARAFYTQAQLVIPQKTYPAQKINEITTLESQLARQEIQAKYDKLVADAETAVAQSNFDTAKKIYAQAGQMMPENPYPARRINEINAMIDQNAKNKKEEKYNGIIAQADQLFNQQQLEQAKQVYQRAITEFPDKQYPKDRITEIKQLVEDLAKQQQQAEFDKLVANAETAVGNEEFEAAKQYLAQASKILPENPYPQRRINEINALIDNKAKNSEEEVYKRLIAQADGLFDGERFEEAKSVYGQAKLKIPENTYPNQRINEINQILAEKARSKVTEQYNRYIAEADQLFADKTYEQAKLKYQEASKVVPENTYPQQKINEINSILAAVVSAEKEKQEIQARYDNAIKLADKYFSEKKYSLAKSEYNNALSVYPDKSYPKEQIAKANNLIDEQQKIMAEQKALEQQIRDAINTADTYFRDKQLALAKENYQKALGLKPDHVHASSQIRRIDAMLEEQALAVQSQKELEERYVEIISNADVKFKGNDFKLARKLYLAALEVKPNEGYPRAQVKKIDDMLLAMASKNPVNKTTQSGTSGGSSGIKGEDLSTKSEREKKEYLNSLKTKYNKGITCEVYKEGNKTTKRYIVFRDNEVHEYREVIYTWGGKSYTFDGKPTNAFHVQKNVKVRDGESYSEIKM